MNEITTLWYQTGGTANFAWNRVNVKTKDVESKVAEINRMGYATKVQNHRPTDYVKFL